MKRKMNVAVFVAAMVSMVISISSCKKDAGGEAPQEPFNITNYYVAGTIKPASGSYTSVYLIKLLDNQKAVFVGTGTDLTGSYTLSTDSLIVTISDPNNYRVARFAINSSHELTSAYYRALTMEYGTTGQLLRIEGSNQLAGKSFIGEEFKMGPASFRQGLVYKFGTTGTTYGAGTDAATINAGANTYELINNSAFKYKSGSTTEIGFVAQKQLTVFRSSGLFYYGKYNQQ